MVNLSEYKNKLEGLDVWIVSAGPSLNHIDLNFFEGKTVFTICWMFQILKPTYVVTSDEECFNSAVEAGHVVITGKYDGTNECRSLNQEAKNIIIYKNLAWEGSRTGVGSPFYEDNLNNIGREDKIFVGCGTAVSAMHIAAYMGAKNIILCGQDCGWIDDEKYIKGYKLDYGVLDYTRLTNILQRFSNGGKVVKERLKEVYGCNICSLNPFINFKLEGHKYAPTQ